MRLGTLTILALLWAAGPDLGAGDSSGNTPPAVLVGLGRSVSVRNEAGGLQRLTTIPTNSAFARHGTGATNKCSLTADRDDFLLSDGSRVPEGTVITSDYTFVEGIASPLDLIPHELPADITNIPSRGPLTTGTRTFSVFCDRTYYDINFRGFIEVPLLDPLFNPRSQIASMLNALQLERPVVFTNPVVTTYGGLVTRYPAWLAIHPAGWATTESPARSYRGAQLRLIAQPRLLDFTVDFTPDSDKPSTPSHDVITCLPDIVATTDGDALPALPALPDQAEPGPNGPCQWTPPGPGTVTITANITFTITFAVNEHTETEPDYVWHSLPTSFPSGELHAVNTKP